MAIVLTFPSSRQRYRVEREDLDDWIPLREAVARVPLHLQAAAS
jgi:hypothetical protein